MTDRVQWVAVAGSVALLVLVLELVRRRRLAEEYSALWIVAALALIGISLWREVLDRVAAWLGVFYPPAVLVLMLVAIISVASLSFSVILSRQQRQIDRLIDENAVLAAEVRELRAAIGKDGRLAARGDRNASSDPPDAAAAGTERRG